MNTTHKSLERFESLVRESLSSVYLKKKKKLTKKQRQQQQQNKWERRDDPWSVVNVGKELSFSLTSWLRI